MSNIQKKCKYKILEQIYILMIIKLLQNMMKYNINNKKRNLKIYKERYKYKKF